MTVLQLISSEGLYGAENMLLSLSSALVRAGCHPVVAAFEDKRSPHTEVLDEAHGRGIESHAIRCNGRFDPGAVGRLREIVKECKPDVLHTHGYKADLFALAARCKPVIATCHNWPDTSKQMRRYAAIDRLALRWFGKVTTPSRHIANTLGRSGVRSTVIPNGIDMTRYMNVQPVLRVKKKLIGCVARLTPAKGVDVLLRAVAKVPDVTVALIGDGPARTGLELLSEALGIRDRVLFLGVRRDMPELYASLDALVLPSWNEAMPMCLLEGLASGCAVIATDVGEVGKLVIHERTGLLLRPGDEGGLAKSLARLLGDSSLAARLGQCGRELVRSGFSSDVMAARYMAVYRCLP